MRLFSPIILILFSTVDGFGNQFPVSNTIAPQLIGDYLPGFTTVGLEQAPEEAFCCSAVAFGLEIDIDDLTILIHGPPQIVLLTIDFDEDFIDVEGVTVTSMHALQSAGV